MTKARFTEEFKDGIKGVRPLSSLDSKLGNINATGRAAGGNRIGTKVRGILQESSY